MKSSRKILALLLSLVLLLSLGGCGYASSTAVLSDKTNWFLYHEETAVYPGFYEGYGYYENGETAQAKLLDTFRANAVVKDGAVYVGKIKWAKDAFIPLFRAPIGFSLSNAAFGQASNPPWNTDYDVLEGCLAVNGIFHKDTCSFSETSPCDGCDPFLVSFDFAYKDKRSHYFFRGTSNESVLPALYTALTAEYVSPEILAAEGSNVLSPFCLPMMPMRLLRLLLGELVKVAFAFGIGWIVVLFAKRRKKTPAAD